MREDELMLMDILKCRRVDLYAQKIPLTDEQQRQFLLMKERRKNGEPLQYILGETEFVNCRIQINPFVLIPRPETEILVEVLLDIMGRWDKGKTIQVLDVGTGSGNIAIALAKNFSSCYVTALDVSSAALDVARKNARLNDVFDKINFIEADMRNFFSSRVNGMGGFDIIVSNPPYIPTRELAHLPMDVRQEPDLALDGGEDGLTYIQFLLCHGPEWLAQDGYLACEIGDKQTRAIENLWQGFQFYDSLNFIKDYTNTDRIFITRKRQHG